MSEQDRSRRKYFIKSWDFINILSLQYIGHMLTLQLVLLQTQGSVLGPVQTVRSVLLTSVLTLTSQVQFTVSQKEHT